MNKVQLSKPINCIVGHVHVLNCITNITNSKMFSILLGNLQVTVKEAKCLKAAFSDFNTYTTDHDHDGLVAVDI